MIDLSEFPKTFDSAREAQEFYAKVKDDVPEGYIVFIPFGDAFTVKVRKL